jgi:hypothetical protein
MRGKRWLTVSIALALTYTGYILWAKFAKIVGPPPFKLSETGEFLLFLAAVLTFTFQVFAEDSRNRAPSTTAAAYEAHPPPAR